MPEMDTSPTRAWRWLRHDGIPSCKRRLSITYEAEHNYERLSAVVGQGIGIGICYLSGIVGEELCNVEYVVTA